MRKKKVSECAGTLKRSTFRNSITASRAKCEYNASNNGEVKNNGKDNNNRARRRIMM